MVIRQRPTICGIVKEQMLAKFFKMLMWRNELDNSAKWFDKNQQAQDRFWEIEDWSEELEERIIQLEANSHPCKELHEFDAYPDLIKRIEKLEHEIINQNNRVDSE